MKSKILSIYLVLFTFFCNAQQKVVYRISSPDKNLQVECKPDEALYIIKYKGEIVLGESRLGVVREDEDFTRGLTVIKAPRPTLIKDNYSMVNAKRKDITYTANRLTIETENASGKKMNIVFQVSNDGVAFRYEFPDKTAGVKKIKAEATSFRFPEGTRAWMQPKTEAQSGFEHTNPSYEAHYMMDIPIGTPSNSSNGWVYPALFKTRNSWIMMTEAGLERNYCGTALQQISSGGEYKINFPQPPEKIANGALTPESVLPWNTPWRVLAIGSLKSIMESTLGTDLAVPAINLDTSFIKPGKASWSWVLEKDGATVYPVQKKYIDYAADMNWQYCLIDANWDQTIGYDSVKLLADYAKQKNIGLLLWYNSAGDWNTVKFTPRNKLLSHESRIKEFTLLKEMGIKGIKIDFFGGDGQSMIAYYQDILDDAAANHLLVNFHGATLPRGWARTYPNLMTAEAVFGYEMITFSQDAANQAPQHSIMSAMVRNVFDPMDFTPMCLYQIPSIKRATTAAFELATSITFLSGIQHYAERPDGMKHVPLFVKDFLRKLPNHWDDVKFIEGYPGKLFVVARKSGNRWYLAGINGEKIEKELVLDLSFLKSSTGKFIFSGGDSNQQPSFQSEERNVPADGKVKLKLGGNDGFVAVFE
jgi:alpha-glucosidase